MIGNVIQSKFLELIDYPAAAAFVRADGAILVASSSTRGARD